MTAGEGRDATNSYHQEKHQFCVTHVEPQSAECRQRGSPNVDDSAAATSETRGSLYSANQGRLSFDQTCFKLAAIAVELFISLAQVGEELVQQVATSVVRDEEGEGLPGKGVLVERIRRMISVTTQVAIATKVQRHRLTFQRGVGDCCRWS